MTILYFSSTGNCLYLSKRIGGEQLSVPKCIEENRYDFEDSVIGIVFPVYGLCIPPFIADFIKKLRVKCDYFFSVATYGFFPGGVCTQLSETVTADGRHFDYINRIKMAENCLTFSDLAKEKGDSEKQQKAIQNLIRDIGSKKTFVRHDSFFHRMMTKGHLKNYEFPTGKGITDKLTISDSCTGCGTCVRICPMKNIRLSDSRPGFGEICVSCGGCIQNCPANAIHHSNEKSGARYRNPHITTEELMMK